jgi:hypothetical protein
MESELFKVIPSITSGVALAAFVAAVIAFVVVQHTKRKQSLLQALPEKDRLKAIRELADDLGISAKHVQSEARVVQLVMARMAQRAAMQRALFALVFGIALLAAGVAAFQIYQNGQMQPTIRVPPPARGDAPGQMPSPASAASASPASQPASTRATTARGIDPAWPRPAPASEVRPQRTARRPAGVEAHAPAASDRDTASPLPAIAHYAPRDEADAARVASVPQPLLGMKVKVVFSSESADVAGRAIGRLQGAGAFVDQEQRLLEQLDQRSSVRYSSQRHGQAEIAAALLSPELRAPSINLLHVVRDYDLEIQVVPMYPR